MRDCEEPLITIPLSEHQPKLRIPVSCVLDVGALKQVHVCPRSFEGRGLAFESAAL